METTLQTSVQQPLVQQAQPISQLDKLKLMIIRIGDERRHLIDEHLSKLKNQLTSAFVLKDKNNREAIVDSLTTCIKLMPHKVNIYTYLIAATSLEDFDFAT
jgi:pyridoxine 5'-phosphate synthase PdxJ